jgi:hypothetical protein
MKQMNSEEIQKLIKSLKEHTLYKIKIKWIDSNPEYYTFLFNGLKSGNYTYIPDCNSIYTIEKIYQAWSIEIIQELCSTDSRVKIFS